jgi:hypothetical protein
MASIISIFFAPQDASQDCRKVLEALLGCSFRLEANGELSRYTAHSVGLEFVWFNNHGLTNDLGIAFESYPFELDISVDRRGIDATIADSYHQYASRYVFELIKDRLGWKAALVHNLQHLLATFPT